MAVRGPKRQTAENSRQSLGQTVRWTSRKPPEGLSEGAQAEYGRLVKLLEENGTLERTDPRLVALYAVNFDLLWKAQAAIERDGLTTQTSRGQVQVHPGVGVINSATMRLKAIINDLGLCPVSQKHGGSIGPRKRDKKSEAPWGELLNLVS